MANALTLQDAVVARNELTAAQLKKISSLYNHWADDVASRAQRLKHKQTYSASVQQQQLRELEKALRKTSQQVASEVEHTIVDGMTKVCQSVVAQDDEWMASLGFPQGAFKAAFSSVPDNVVRNIVTGKIYASGWSLSESIWGDNEDTLAKIHEIVGGGLAENKSTYEIAKDLEQFVRPDAAKQWNLRTKSGKLIYPKRVDYNAQRLARTLSQHAYQQTVKATAKENPFIKKIRWHSIGGRACPLCLARDGKVYALDELPMDHPNGMCIMEQVVDKDIDERLLSWVDGKSDPELDAFAKTLGISVGDVGTGETQSSTGESETETFAKMTEDEYKEFLANNSTYARMEREIADKYGTEDVYFEEEHKWLYDIKNEALDVYLQTLSGQGHIGYVQDADGSKMINSYWRSGGNKEVLRDYTGRLRGKKLEAVLDRNVREIKETSKALDKMIASSTIDSNVIVDRWAGIKSLERMGIDVGGVGEHRIGHAFVSDFDPESVAKQIRERLLGATIVDNGYMSASMQSDLNVFRGSDIKYSIQVPKGTNAYITDNAAESEVIFPKGTQQEIVDVKVSEAEAFDYDGSSKKRKVVEIVVRIVKE